MITMGRSSRAALRLGVQLCIPFLKLNKVSLHYCTHILLDEVDFAMRKGDRIGLLGRNGAGNKPRSGGVFSCPTQMYSNGLQSRM